MTNQNKTRVGILMGSLSDRDKMRGACQALDHFGIGWDAHVMSAHRCPDKVRTFVLEAPERGIQVLIAGAGWAAHLAGAVAAHATLPVVGVPLSGSALSGEDALLATVQMPKGVPVATVAIDAAYNAGVLAAQIIALGDAEVAARLVQFKKDQEAKIAEADASLDMG